jgi:hypothetical protein
LAHHRPYPDEGVELFGFLLDHQAAEQASPGVPEKKYLFLGKALLQKLRHCQSVLNELLHIELFCRKSCFVRQAGAALILIDNRKSIRQGAGCHVGKRNQRLARTTMEIEQNRIGRVTAANEHPLLRSVDFDGLKRIYSQGRSSKAGIQK